MISARNNTQMQSPSFGRWSTQPYTQRVVGAMKKKLADEGITQKTHPNFYKNYEMLTNLESKVFGPAVFSGRESCHELQNYKMDIWMDKFERSDLYQKYNATKIVGNKIGPSYKDYEHKPEFHPNLVKDDYTLGDALFNAIHNINDENLKQLEKEYNGQIGNKI